MSLDFIAIDFETANTYQNSACSVGLVRFVDGEEVESVHSLIRPPKMYFIPEWTEEIHHICADDVREMPKFPEIWNSIVMPFVSKTPNLPFVAHNASFDMGVIQTCYQYYEMGVPDFRYFDSLQLARKTWSNFDCHKLTFLGEQFGIEYNAHDAQDDSRTCGKIIVLAAKKWKATTVEELLTKCGLEMKKLSNSQ